MSTRPHRSQTGRLPPGATVLLIAGIMLVIGHAANLWRELSQREAAAAGVAQTSTTVDRLRVLHSMLASAESSHLSFVLTRDPRHARSAEESARHLGDALQHAETALRLNPAHAEGFAQVQAMATGKLTAFATALEFERTGRHSEAVHLLAGGESRAATARALELLAQQIATQHDRLVVLQQQAFARGRRVAVSGVVIGGITLAVAVICYGLARRHARGWRDAEAALREAHETQEQRVTARTAQLAGLSRHLLDAGEREKAALARELHDELGSNLTAINLDIAAVANQLKTQDPTSAARLTRAVKVLKDTVELKRRIIQGLRPSVLESLGLVAALSMCCEEFTDSTGLPCATDLPDELEVVNDDAAIALYRVVEEALINVARHAQASRAEVRLVPDDDMLHLTIIDDGIGISPDALGRPLVHGLLGLRERIARLGGSLSVLPGDPGGTVIEVRVPRNAEPAGGVPTAADNPVRV
jgi:signal transduction histidine kinase